MKKSKVIFRGSKVGGSVQPGPGKRAVASGLALGLVAASQSASAAIDTAPITTALTDAGVAAGVVGAAVLVVIVGIRAFKMIRMAM